MSNFLTDEDQERTILLDIVSRQGLKVLSIEELLRLQALLERKHYGNNKKTVNSQMKLLQKISHEIQRKQKGGFCV